MDSNQYFGAAGWFCIQFNGCKVNYGRCSAENPNWRLGFKMWNLGRIRLFCASPRIEVGHIGGGTMLLFALVVYASAVTTCYKVRGGSRPPSYSIS